VRRDITAVKNALTERWSNGQTEGQINRLKTLKRAMYGRASIELLRARILPLSLLIDPLSSFRRRKRCGNLAFRSDCSNFDKKRAGLESPA
jgi:hypothetical protein